MKTMIRLLMIAVLASSFAACKKAEAPVAVKAPVPVPVNDNRQAWIDYLSDVVERNMDGIANQPYVYLLPGESSADFQDQYDRLADKAKSDVSRGIISGNMLAYGSPASAKMADLVVAAFTGVPTGSMKGVKVLFVGKAEDNDRVKAAVTPAGVDYVFVEAK
ncbi:hypothetical protein [Lysobacter telluris]|jgi:hypothetical protein|uniref:hypothetical protein n=1 Tax=Cognatiluteimonas telluris TaxID=1104775 RepID=UPI00140E6188